MGSADLKDDFYHLGLPVSLRRFFSLPRVKASDVGITEVHGRVTRLNQKITPRLAVVPMG